MVKKLVLALCFVLGFSLISYAKVLDVSDFVLNNGLRVYVVSNHKAPVGLVKLYYKAGSVCDPLNKGGIAHLLEHMMFRGTKKVRNQDFNTITEKNGADNNAYTTYLHTGYYEFSDISKLELMLALEADRMENLKLDKDVFLKERDVVLEERMQRFETNQITKFYEKLNKEFWLKHPFARPVSGEIEEIKRLNLSDARDFYYRYYNPSNAILVIVGDITVDEAKKLVVRYFAKIDDKQKFEDNVIIEGLPEEEIDLELNIDGVVQPRFISYWHLNGKDFSKKEILALEFLIEYLFGDDTAYMVDKLVYKDKKYLNVGGSVDYDEEYGGKLSFYMLFKDKNISLNEIKEDLRRELVNGFNKITDSDIEKIKNETLSNVVYMFENPISIANFVGGMLISNYEIEDVENYDEMIKSVSRDDVVNVWKKVFDSKIRKVNGLTVIK